MHAVHPPPRLLIGAALLFWGGMTERPVIGLVLALLVEGAKWTRLRWNFDDAAFNRAWQLSTIAVILTAVLLWMEGDRRHLMPALMGWLPALLFPVQFVQSYGIREALPLNSFAIFARHRRERNRLLGLPESIVHLNFGNVTFFAALACSTIGRHAQSPVFLPGLVLLTAWAVLSTRIGRPAMVGIALMASFFLAIGGQSLLKRAADWVNRGGNDGSSDRMDPSYFRTAIGNLGEIKQSPKILWRLRTERGVPPKLLRTGSYNRYRRGIWDINVPDEPGADRNDFVDLLTYQTREQSYYLTDPARAPAEAVASGLSRFRMRGAAVEYQQIPLPGNASALADFPLDGIERNSLGSTRIFPQRSVIDGEVLWEIATDFERPPLADEDLLMTKAEAPAIRQVVEEHGLVQEANLRDTLGGLMRYFSDFEYTRYLSIRQPGTGSRDSLTAISEFLLTEKRGHCEYFATAACLLLREMGIPARYVVGFAVAERDPKVQDGFTLRGTHFHAWCRVWDEAQGTWIDFDPTPASWLPIELRRADPPHPFADAIQRFREDFFIWRGRPENRLLVGGIFALIGIAVAGYVFVRLWTSRQRLAAEAEGKMPPFEPTPLNFLEPEIARVLGRRPRSQPLAEWMTKLAPMLPADAPLAEALGIHQQLRYDPRPRDASRLADLTRHVSRIREFIDALPDLQKPTPQP